MKRGRTTRWIRAAWLVGGLNLLACDDLSRATADIEETIERTERLWGVETESAGPAFYRYQNRAGRTVFVSDRSLVPPGLEAHPFDVSHVDLNEDLGAELDAAARTEHETLVDSPFCDEATGSTPEAIDHVLRHERHWLGIGLAVVVLIVTAPWVARRVGTSKWTRTLSLAVPLLLFLGILVQVLTSTRRSLHDAREVSALCDPEAMADAPDSATRLSIVQKLRSQIAQAHQNRHRQVDSMMRDADYLKRR